MKYSEAHDDAAWFGLAREVFDKRVVARFTVDGEPVSKSRARFTKRGSKTHAYTPEKTHAAEQTMAWKFRQAAQGHVVSADETYGVTALFFPATRQRRDVDNMMKLILDGLNGVAWKDDDQVVEISGRKNAMVEPDHARTEVVVYEVGRVFKQTGNCEHCGAEYDTYRSWTGTKRFCSQKCHHAWRRERRARNCQQCGQPFQASKPDSAAKYCSRDCASAARRATVTCNGCGADFTKQRSHVRAKNYCSEQCRQAYWRRARKTAALGTCETCGGPTSKKTYRQCAGCRQGQPTGRPRPLINAGSKWEPGVQL